MLRETTSRGRCELVCPSRTKDPRAYRRELDTVTQTPSDVQSRRAPALKNTCHDARFAPHVGANVNAGYILIRSLPQRAFHLTDHVQQDIHPTDNPPSARKSGAGEAQRRVGRRWGAPELNPPKSACAGDAALRTSTRGTVPMGQCAG